MENKLKDSSCGILNNRTNRAFRDYGWLLLGIQYKLNISHCWCWSHETIDGICYHSGSFIGWHKIHNPKLVLFILDFYKENFKRFIYFCFQNKIRHLRNVSGCTFNTFMKFFKCKWSKAPHDIYFFWILLQTLQQ